MFNTTALGLIATGFLAVSLSATSADAQSPDWIAVEAHAEAMMDRHDLDGVSLVIGAGDDTAYEIYLGDHTPQTTHIMASSTKLVTSVILLSLVEDGVLSLDQRVSEDLGFLEARFAEVTLRQMLNHTSGMSSDHGLEHAADISLSESAQALSVFAPTHTPGDAVNYGGGGLITAAAWAEQVAGQSWQSLYQERVAGPLGLVDSYFGNPTDRDAGAEVRNPTVTGGYVASTREYRRIMASLTGGETVLLAPETRSLLLTHHSQDADRSDMPGPIPEEGGTSLGIWCEDIQPDQSCGSVHSLGAYGTLPWIDQQAGVYGLLMINGNLRDVLPDLRELQALVRAAASN